MLVWGAAWGALIGLGLSGFDVSGAVLGGLVGVLAGWTLQRAVDARVKALLPIRPLVDPASTRPLAPPAPRRPPVPVPAPPPPVAVSAVADAVPAPRAAASATAATTAGYPWASAAPRALAATAPGLIDDALARAKAWLLGGNTVARVGALVLFIGLAFLARFAAERGLVPPQVRLAGIGLVAIVLLVIGFRLRKKSPGYALTLQGAGIAVLYLTLFAAFRLYGLLPPVPAFGLMVAVCALAAALAVLQDSRALAVIGTAGGFVAPILASTGQGDHVALFSYYTVLNLGILGIALKKDWRLLNAVGFVFTFGIATVWGVLRYRPEHYASTQPFLIVFFLMYVAVAVLFALRRERSGGPVMAKVDTMLVFGTPLIGFGLQAALVRGFEYGLAWSALAVAAVYLLLAALIARRRLQPLRLLVESFLALGVIFVSLAIPFALDARWTAASWALEGAAIVWVGLRQQRRLARAFGLLLQLGGLVGFLFYLEGRVPQLWPVLNADFIGAVLLAGAALFISRQFESRHGAITFAEPNLGLTSYESFERVIAPLLFLYGFAWWFGALLLEFTREVPVATGRVFAVAPADRLFPLMAGFVLSASVAAWIGLRRNWQAATWPAYASIVVMWLAALAGAVDFRHVFTHWGWLAWPVAIVAHLVALRGVDQRKPQPWFVAVHALGVVLLCFIGANGTHFLIDSARLWRTSWGPAAALAAAALLLAAFTAAAFSRRLRLRWPMDRFARAYGWFGMLPAVVLTLAGALLMTLTQRGDATPLPHLPLVNPVDLAYLVALSAVWGWRERLVDQDWPLPEWLRNRQVAIGAIGIALFVMLNTMWLRAVHHFAGIRWNMGALFDSFLVQTGYALLWTTTAVALMVFASRRRVRAPWLVGAALLGLTVVKLFVVDLENAGGAERIVAFIGVGGLMLLVGYLAPLPPRADAVTSAEAR